MQAHLQHLLLPLLLAASITGCSSSRGTVQSTGENHQGDTLALPAASLSDSAAITAIRRLEAAPLAPESAALRRDLFAWLISSPKLSEFATATLPIDELQTTAFPYKEELLVQYLLGSAAWSISGAPGTIVDQQEAGIRSLIAAYRNIVQGEPASRNTFLDRLDGLRRRGELRQYLQRIHDQKGKG